MPRIITAAFALEGIETEYRFYPWQRALMLAQRGEVDATGLWAYKPERTEHFYHSDVVHDSEWAFFHLKENTFDWQSFDDLKHIQLGGVRGFTYGDAFYRAEQAGITQVQWLNEQHQAFKLLLAKRIDIVPAQPEIAFFHINKLYGPETAQLFTYHAKPFHSFKLHLLFSKNTADAEAMTVAFNRGLARLKASGEFQRYLIDDVKNGVYLDRGIDLTERN